MNLVSCPLDLVISVSWILDASTSLFNVTLHYLNILGIILLSLRIPSVLRIPIYTFFHLKKRCCHTDCTCQWSFNASSHLEGCSPAVFDQCYEHYRCLVHTWQIVVNRILMNCSRALSWCGKPSVSGWKSNFYCREITTTDFALNITSAQKEVRGRDAKKLHTKSICWLGWLQLPQEDTTTQSLCRISSTFWLTL